MNTILQYIDWLDKFTIVVSAFTLLFSWRNWVNQRKYNKKQLKNISITLKCTDKAEGKPIRKALPQTIKRKYFSRSELQGTLANCYQGDNRYNINYLGSQDFANAIEAVQNGESDNLEILIEDQQTFNTFIGNNL